MSQRICEIEHPRGRYSSDSSVCFPMRTNTTVAVSTCVKTAYISVLCITRHVSQHWVSKMSLSSVAIAINNRKPLNAKSPTTLKKSYKPLSVLRKLNYKRLEKHSWCSSDSSGDWHLFSLLVIYNSLMNANKAKPQPVSYSHMMDDLLREFRNLFAFGNPPPAPRTYTQKHTFKSSISCAPAQRWDRYVHT